VGNPRKKCTAGKSCSATCISKDFKCEKKLPAPVSDSLSRNSERLLHLGEHVGANVTSWKAGKVVGPLVSKYLETRYGIPPETTEKLSETIVQAVVATGLHSRHLKSGEDFVRDLLTEASAAFLGKSAHSGVDSFLTSQESREIVQQALPLLAGKFTGIGAAFAGSKLPKVSQISSAVSRKYSADLLRLQKLFRSSEESFSEQTDQVASAKLLGDLSLLSVLLSLKG